MTNINLCLIKNCFFSTVNININRNGKKSKQGSNVLNVENNIIDLFDKSTKDTSDIMQRKIIQVKKIYIYDADLTFVASDIHELHFLVKKMIIWKKKD